MVPIRQVVVKVNESCNFGCPGCYVYQLDENQAKRTLYKPMSEIVAAKTGERIAEHAQAHGLHDMTAVLHGGEPFLNMDHVARVIRALRQPMPDDVTLHLRAQTNGSLLTRNSLEVLRAYDVRIGVSLDGKPDDHNKARPLLGGQESYSRVAAGLRLLGEDYRDLFGGILCTINTEHDPLETYAELMRYQPPEIDFLLPHHTWNDPPPNPAGVSVPYAKWLHAIFNEWVESGDALQTSVRLFDSILTGLHGTAGGTEALGLSPASFVVVDAGGAIRQVDALQAIAADADETGMHISTHSFDEVLRHPAIAYRQLGQRALSDICQRCDIVATCGGGLFPHRYKDGNFRHPSVYCPDLMAIIKYVQTAIGPAITKGV